MSNHTVPTPPLDKADAVRVGPCKPSLSDDLGSIVIECYHRDRRPFPWHRTYPDLGDGTEADVVAAFAAHRAECKADAR